MALIRVISQVDKEGRIKLPANIRRAAGLREGLWLEMKVGGSSRKKNIRMTPRDIPGKFLVKSPGRAK